MKKSYKKTIAILIVVVGAYHVLLFGMHPKLPPVEKAEIIWGDLTDTPSANKPEAVIDTSMCQDAAHAMAAVEKTTGADTEATERVRFEYRPAADTFINTGNTASILMEDGSTMNIGKQSYPLREMAFTRSPSSGHITLNLIHRIKDGRLAVVLVPLQVTDTPNSAIEALWRYLPKYHGDHNSLDDLHIDLTNLLPRDRTFYRYPASDGCNQGVVILGLTSPVQISATQMAKLDKVLQHRKDAQNF